MARSKIDLLVIGVLTILFNNPAKHLQSNVLC